MPPKLLINSQPTQTPFLSVNGGTSVPTAQPSFLSKVGDFLFGNPIAQGVAEAVQAPSAPKSFNPTEIANAGWDSLTAGIKQSANAISNFENTLGDVFGTAIARATATPQAKPYITSSVSPLDVGVSTANAALGIANASFAPLTSAIQTVAHIPGVGYAADALNNIMGAVGQAVAIPTGLAVDSAYQKGIISADTRDKIKPPLQNFAALLAQIAVGKVGADAVKEIKIKATEAVNSMNTAIEAAKKAYEMGPVKPLIVNGESTTNPIPFANDYRAPEKIIQMGAKPRETLPIAAYSPSEAPIVPESARTATITSKTENIPTELQDFYNKVTNPTVPEASQSLPTPESRVVPLNEPATKEITPQKTGKITKAASDINQTLVRQGYEALSPEEQSKYTPESYKEIAQNVENVMSTNLEDAKKIATGEILVDKKLYGQGELLFKTISKLATKEGDGELLQKLAASPFGKKESLAGQTLGESGFASRTDGVDAVETIQQVENFRKTAVEKKGTDVIKETTKDEQTFKREVKTSRSSRPTWEEFVKKITCNV